jgi:RNA polymerase sigma-70 factor (family 1)
MSRTPIHDEQQLVQRLRNGDASAFEEIFRLYWKPLYTTAKLKLHSHDDAEEVIQGIFSALWEQRGKLAIDNLSAYLQASVRNRVINVIRARITQQKYWAHYGKFIPTTQNTTENLVVFDDLNDVLEAAVSRLPEKSRKVFKLSRLEGRSNSEIAHLLKVSEKAIEYHLTKSLREIRLHIKDYITFFIFLLIF